MLYNCKAQCNSFFYITKIYKLLYDMCNVVVFVYIFSIQFLKLRSCFYQRYEVNPYVRVFWCLYGQRWFDTQSVAGVPLTNNCLCNEVFNESSSVTHIVYDRREGAISADLFQLVAVMQVRVAQNANLVYWVQVIVLAIENWSNSEGTWFCD